MSPRLKPIADCSLDIDDLFGGGGPVDKPDPSQRHAKEEPTSPETSKAEPVSPDAKPKVERDSQDAGPRAKPKAGRLVSNEQPLEDFNRLIKSKGDIFNKAVG